MNLKSLENAFKNKKNFSKIFFSDIKHKKSFQRFEFLGDRVVGLSLASELFSRYPKYDEGKLATIFSFLTSAIIHEKISKDIELDIYLKNKGFNISTKVLSDYLEAILGALFIDSGFTATKDIILKLWGSEIYNNKDIKRDVKTILQEWSQSKKLGLPSYRILKKRGADHNPSFTVEINIKNYDVIKGKGKSLQLAEKNAAKKFINKFIKDI